MTRIITQIGDIFCAKLDSGNKYFQYIANDMTMLNSSVIRVFKKLYSNDVSPDLQDVISDEVDFYAHVVLRWGIEMGLWEKVGKMIDIGTIDILFRFTQEIGPEIKTSNKWQVWKINEPFQYIGKLEEKNKSAELGIVVNPVDIIDRMKTGEYKFKYPEV